METDIMTNRTPDSNYRHRRRSQRTTDVGASSTSSQQQKIVYGRRSRNPDSEISSSSSAYVLVGCGYGAAKPSTSRTNVLSVLYLSIRGIHRRIMEQYLSWWCSMYKLLYTVWTLLLCTAQEETDGEQQRSRRIHNHFCKSQDFRISFTISFYIPRYNPRGIKLGKLINI